MENKAIDFIIKNKWALLISVLGYLFFMYFSYEGNRICDCASTQNYSNGDTSHRGTHINRFYHK
ncbi:hypothetical protein [Flavobacterium sp.]|uniref:hypothetical protein n=1 Tax=Flavobacterium sp. TaxID=239 RepID=UPI003D0D8883